MTASKSKWFVGSSSMSNVGSMKSARANEILILQPPLNILVGFVCISPSKPRPKRMRRALASADAAPILLSSSRTSCRRVNLAGSSSPLSMAAVNVFSSSRRFQRTLSAFNTASTAGVLSAWTSCSTYRKSTRGGRIKSLDDIIFSSVLLPLPFGPTRPYLLPCAMLNEASLKRILPAALMLKLGMLMSKLFCHCGSFSFTAV
mmetsp:Transcript_27782/g.66136  ORF Transcript_27782/g.66136 Transcript_27782/m.66136 type:complete len:203 (+) Transcript_27782:1194-1802(+)